MGRGILRQGGCAGGWRCRYGWRGGGEVGFRFESDVRAGSARRLRLSRRILDLVLLLRGLEGRGWLVCRCCRDSGSRLWRVAIVSRCPVGLYLDGGLICGEELEQSRYVGGIWQGRF